MNPGEFQSPTNDPWRPRHAMLIARGEQARRVVATLVERLARLEEVCRSLIQEPQDGGGQESELVARLDQWTDRQRRRELEQDDLLRDIQRELGELNSAVQLANAARPAATSGKAAKPTMATPSATGNSGWELAKQRLLAELDGEDSTGSITEGPFDAAADPPGLLAKKDAEIQELKGRIEEQNHLSQAIELDALVQQERQKLRRLQADWEDKLRKSEIEISIERAKLARERTQLEEKLRRLAPPSEVDPKPEYEKVGEPSPEKASRGRWLARLGLLDNDAT